MLTQNDIKNVTKKNIRWIEPDSNKKYINPANKAKRMNIRRYAVKEKGFFP